MRVKDHIREGLDELRAAGRINKYVHALLLTRTNSLIAGDCGDFYQTVRNELLGLGMHPDYTAYGEVMTPLSFEKALARFDQNEAVYFIFEDDTELLCECRSDIEADGFFAAEHDMPQSLVQQL